MAEMFRDMLQKKGNITTVGWIERKFDDANCDKLVEFCSKLGLSQAEVVSKDGGALAEGRASRVAAVPRREQTLSLYKSLASIAETVNRETYNFALDGFFEDIQFAEYPEGAGFFDWHLDVGQSVHHRKLSIIVQLSDEDEYEGGELQTMVSEQGIQTAPKSRGTVIIFPSFLLHRVTPVTSGIRRSLVCWASGPAFR